MNRNHVSRWLPRKAEGKPTRGKTAHNRLRRVDNFLLMYDSSLLKRRDGAFKQAYFVDLGYGEKPVTTLESAQRFRQINPQLPVLGVEIDPARVENAKIYADRQTSFRQGGFNLPLNSWPNGTPETVRAVRAFNVLRQYDETSVRCAYQRLFQYILPGGLLIEGTSDPFGRIWVANVIRKSIFGKQTWHTEAIVFSTNFRNGFDPAHFQPVLPKKYIHRMSSNDPVTDFFKAWKQAALETRSMKVWGLRQWFAAGAQKLDRHGYKINLRKKWLDKGWLIWEQPKG